MFNPPGGAGVRAGTFANYVDGHESHERKEENGLIRTHGDAQGDRVGRVQ